MDSYPTIHFFPAHRQDQLKAEIFMSCNLGQNVLDCQAPACTEMWSGVELAEVSLSPLDTILCSNERLSGHFGDQPVLFCCRKEESVVFPEHLQLNLPNLIRFVLRHGASALKLETGLSICSKTCIHSNLASTSHTIQTLQRNTRQISEAIVVLRRFVAAKKVAAKSSNRRSEHAAPCLWNLSCFAGRSVDVFFSTNVAPFALCVKETEFSLLFCRSMKELRARAQDGADREALVSEYRTVQNYMDILNRKAQRRKMQLSSARQLHSSLLASQGPYIEKHKLSGILKRYKKYQEQMKRRFKREVSGMDEASGAKGQSDVARDKF